MTPFNLFKRIILITSTCGVPTKKVFVGYEAKQAKNLLLFFNKKNKAEIALLPLVDFCTIFYYLFHLLFLPTATYGVPTKKKFLWGMKQSRLKTCSCFLTKKTRLKLPCFAMVAGAGLERFLLRLSSPLAHAPWFIF